MKSADGYLVGLDRTLDEGLVAEGIARELVNRVQRLRRDSGLEVSDRIELGIRGSQEVESAANEHRDYIAGETLAVGVQIGGEGDGGSEEWRDSELDGHPVRIGLSRAR